ncbi:MAG: DEAD/DEAH box helicase, partial [Muribaculaceae bacterium]
MTENQILEAARKSLGIESLNPLQLAVSASTASRLIILAPTGSGKTLAFALAMLRDIEPGRPGVKAVVIAPSRELVIQIADVVRPLALPMKTVALYGGHSFADERNSLSVKPDIIIATPGRLLDHLNRDTIGIIEPRVVVLDEYDKALELGFHDEMRRVVRRLGHPQRVILT